MDNRMCNNVSPLEPEKAVDQVECVASTPVIKHEDLRNLLYWKGRTVIDWTEDDMKLGHLIRKLHYYPAAVLTDEDKAVVRRVVIDRSKSQDKINDLSHLKMWIPAPQNKIE